MIIAQLTDLHLGFNGPDNRCINRARLEMVLADIRMLRRQPDIMLLTGDLTENGDKESYEALRDVMETVACPVYYLMGNHDNRDEFRRIFPQQPFNDGFLHYVIEDWPVRVVVLDTLEPGRHGGAFCEARAKWLEETLAQDSKPTLIALHHPPIKTGIDWMTAQIDAQWVLRLSGIIKKFDHVHHVIAGHIHRTIYKRFANTTLSVSPAIAPQVKLELAAISPDVADGRPLLVDSPPGYSLHTWNGKRMTSHTEQCPMATPIVRHDEEHSFIVRHTLDMKSKAKDG